MRKTLTYSSFIIITLVVIVMFVTATTYIQLAVAVILYPLLAFFAFKILPRKAWKAPIITIRLPAKRAEKARTETAAPKAEPVEVTDIDKRTFLKLIGAAGLSFFVFSFLGRRAESLLFGEPSGSRVTENPSTANNASTAGSPPTAGYKISEVDDNDTISYYGFIGKDGDWLIMREDTDISSFRYAKGNSNFPNNWTKRENLKYDYFHNLF